MGKGRKEARLKCKECLRVEVFYASRSKRRCHVSQLSQWHRPTTFTFSLALEIHFELFASYNNNNNKTETLFLPLRNSGGTTAPTFLSLCRSARAERADVHPCLQSTTDGADHWPREKRARKKKKLEREAQKTQMKEIGWYNNKQ